MSSSISDCQDLWHSRGLAPGRWCRRAVALLPWLGVLPYWRQLRGFAYGRRCRRAAALLLRARGCPLKNSFSLLLLARRRRASKKEVRGDTPNPGRENSAPHVLRTFSKVPDNSYTSQTSCVTARRLWQPRQARTRKSGCSAIIGSISRQTMVVLAAYLPSATQVGQRAI